MQSATASLWIGPQLRKLRVLADLRAGEVARRAGLNATQLSHIESGRRPVSPARAGQILRAITPPPAGPSRSGGQERAQALAA